MSNRSPKSWVKSMRYGVSPQPAHAPEYSKSGSRNCEALWSSRTTSARCEQVQEKIVIGPLSLHQRRLWRHIDRLVPGICTVLCRADVDAQVAAGAVLRG